MSDPLPFTGERFTPECQREIWYEHWHRYAFALPFARGRRVLDAACGEGYGSALLASHAQTVLGVDSAPVAIEHARARYGSDPKLSFSLTDVTALSELPDASFDLIVSFETLEHVAAQEAMVAGFSRLLAPRGLLLLSSPDKHAYSELAGTRNEHHVRELYRGELESLLGAHFSAVRLYGQKLLFQSAIWDLSAQPSRWAAVTADAHGHQNSGLDYRPLYFLAFCAKRVEDLPSESAGLLSVFGDRGEAVYRHYQHEIRHNIAAGAVLADLEKRLALAEARADAAERRAATTEPAGKRSWIGRLFRQRG